METRHRAAQPEQPPKQAAYSQAANPVSHTPQEQRESAPTERHYGDALGSITRRTANSQPSNDAARARLDEEHKQAKREMQDSPDVDLEYGVEQQPAEGYIADSVERKGMGLRRAQAGAHAGPVGSAAGPGHPGFGEQEDLARNLDQKRVEHDRILGDRIGRSPAGPEYDVADRQAVRQRHLARKNEIDVEEAVKDTSGSSVAH
ncbi:hypothetical protein N7462_000763 [Penicillium macrosclerotiorum]|uniref:uncharacterized protein n=1 Tax=Penicillium macrosclerotiorum TaxID=303699 RepID=UPI002547C3F2|nr:uncharacterized protein N7462_000763 [Penicillium macrosclerotiorum]KAJ5698758.1 hypothetical protein N7462_000763 [Penicillium macrosclerotiorum]